VSPRRREVKSFDVSDDGHRVLLVEDDPALRQVYAGSLSELGHVVRTAGDGAAALNQLTDDWKPCVVFLDLRMPGMDGWEFARRLRAQERWKDLPIIVVAAHFRIDQEAREIGAAAWLQKPFDLNRLDEQIRRFCPDGSNQARG
jgi:CheY-like chemotaxis protein